MVTLSELQLKEVVILQSGRKLGFIADFDIDNNTGSINALIVSTKQEGGNLFNRMTETTIPWKQIVTIGDDVILVNDENKTEILQNNEGSDRNK